MKKPVIVVVGSSNTDMVIKSQRIPVPGETVLGGRFVMAPGGKGGNQAVAAARLGGDVVFVARVGDDMLGSQAIENYRKEGIDVSYVTRDSDEATGVALILVDDKGENLISVASGANYRLGPDDVDRAADVIRSADMVVVQLETPLPAIARVAKIGADAGVPVILDPAPAPNDPIPAEILEKITFIKPNENEASRLTGMEVTDADSARRAAERLLAQGVRGVIVTLGTAGALIVEKGKEPILIPSRRVDAVDSTAAGDCFSGGLAVGLAEGKTLEEAARFAAAAAALSVTRLGAQPSLPTLDETLAFMKE